MKVTITTKDLSRVWVTADHHLGHENIIKFCERPFVNVLEMDEALIDNWNEVVRPQDMVIHLADFTLGEGKQAQFYFEQLNGNICILSYPWHHDKRWLITDLPLKSKSGFEVLRWPPMVVLEVPELGKDGHPLAITLCHYPMAEWDRKHYGAWHLHGHSHGNHTYTAEVDYGLSALDIGVDCHNYYPVSLEGIAKIMGKRRQNR